MAVHEWLYGRGLREPDLRGGVEAEEGVPVVERGHASLQFRHLALQTF